MASPAKIQSLTDTSSDGSPLQDERESPARDDTCEGDCVCPVSSKQGTSSSPEMRAPSYA
jgi:hypothetical protein